MTLAPLVKKITSAVSEKPSHFAICSDRWDRTWYEQTNGAIDRLAELTEHLREVHPAGGDAMADLFMILSKGAPKREERERMRPDRAVNHLIAEQVINSDGVRDVRRFSVGSQIQTALGCITFAPHLEALYALPEVQEAQDKAEAAQEAQDRLDDLMGPEPEPDAEPGDSPLPEPGDEPGQSDGAGDQEERAKALAQAEDELADALGDLDETLDRITARVGQVCREAARQAGEQAGQRAELTTTWGNQHGEWDRMDPSEYIERAQVIDTPEFRQIADVFGKMQNLRIGAHRERVDGTPTEVFSIELGNDLDRLLPSEKIGLVVPELEDDFYRRYGARRLLQYQLRSIEHRAQGGIIAIEDSSGSMEGQRHCWAKGFGLSLGAVARDNDRVFHALEFGWRGQHKHHPFPDRRSWTAERMMDYAGSFLNGGGTDFETSLDWAKNLLATEYEDTGRTSGDVVVITDGECEVGPTWLDGFLAEKERLGFKVYTLLVGRRGYDQGVRPFSDFVAHVTNFTDGSDVRDVFRAVA